MKVSILGTDYEIRELNGDEYPKLKALEARGLAELYAKELIIEKDMEQTLDGREYACFEEFKKKVIRHEIIHAFFHESGLPDYCSDEDLINWISLQIPKMMKAMHETGCI